MHADMHRWRRSSTSPRFTDRLRIPSGSTRRSQRGLSLLGSYYYPCAHGRGPYRTCGPYSPTSSFIGASRRCRTPFASRRGTPADYRASHQPRHGPRAGSGSSYAGPL